MITFLEGTLEEKSPTRVVLNVQGVGYEVLIPVSSFDRLPSEGETCRLLIYDHIREDLHQLYGFTDEDQRGFFQRILGITGIGPKLAVSALSGLSVRDFKRAVIERDIKRISSISGIGKKTAERIIMELQDKISESEALEAVHGSERPLDGASEDAVKALVSLGYSRDSAAKMVVKAREKLGSKFELEDLIRHALSGT